MINLKEFIESNKANSQSVALAPPSSTEIAANITVKLSGISGLGLSNSDQSKFSSEVAKLASSDEVITELSNSIGMPQKHESEDEFVSRAKSVFKKILLKKLDD